VKRFPRQRVVINIRGTNSSGKSTIVRKMMDKFSAKPAFTDKRKIWAYEVWFEPRFWVLGDYTKPLGGCDGIRTIPEVMSHVKHLATNNGNVLFEGILVSILAEPWIELAKSMTDTHFIFATLDTPLEKCIRRAEKRKEKVKNASCNPDYIRAKYQAVQETHEILKKAKLDVRRLSHTHATQTLINWLLESRYGNANK
jgi:hypothetical protein